MDARVYGVAVTPRTGKPVEVNALWVNGLAAVSELAGRPNADERVATARRPRLVRERFPAPTGWLHDVLDGPPGVPVGGPPCTTTTRCAPTSCWPGRCRTRRYAQNRPHRRRRLAATTPLGMRSLAPTEPAYHGMHEGADSTQTSAYHQGTVWPRRPARESTPSAASKSPPTRPR